MRGEDGNEVGRAMRRKRKRSRDGQTGWGEGVNRMRTKRRKRR